MDKNKNKKNEVSNEKSEKIKTTFDKPCLHEKLNFTRTKNESFNGKLRDELLNEDVFTNHLEAPIVVQR